MLHPDRVSYILEGLCRVPLFYMPEDVERVFGVTFSDSQREMLSSIPFGEDVIRDTASTHMLFPCLPLSLLDIQGVFPDQFDSIAVSYLKGRKERFAHTKLPVGWRLLRVQVMRESLFKVWEDQRVLLRPNEVLPPVALVAYAYFLHLGIYSRQLFQYIRVRCREKDRLGHVLCAGASFMGRSLSVKAQDRDGRDSLTLAPEICLTDAV